MRRTISFIYGGRSTEHDASLKSYEHFMDRISNELFSVAAPVYIGRQGEIRIGENLVNLSELISYIVGHQEIFWINLLHGQEGEDGPWSGLFEIINGKGTFESVFTSAILMDKYAQSSLVAQACPGRLQVPATLYVQENTDYRDSLGKINRFGNSEVIVKPNSMGASHFVGKFHVSEVHGIEDFITSIFPYSKSVLIQEFIYGTEYTCGVMNEQGRPTALPVIRVSTASGVLGHQEKHQHGSAQITFEDSAISKEIQRISIELFELFRVNGMVRFDFLVCNH